MAKILDKIILLILVLFCKENCQSIIDISNYSYPTVNTSSSDDDYVIAIMGTNDIHGFVFPQRYTHPSDNGTKYFSGGAEYFYPYVKILREEWGDRFLYLNAGDQFDGGVEFLLSDGEVMNAFLNYTKVDGASLGNHEFGKGLDYIRNHMSQSNFPYIDSNIINKTTGEIIDLPKLVSSKVYDVGNIKVGIIGLLTVTTPQTSGKTYDDIVFEDYVPHIREESAKLKTEGVDSIVVLAHLGPICDMESKKKFGNKIWTKEDIQEECNYNEFISMMEELEEDEVDAIIAGHTHDMIHKWINNIPVIQSTGSAYSNILYLHFEKVDGKYRIKRDQTQIEGPLPSCQKIFDDNLRCEYRPISDDKSTWNMSSFSYHGFEIKRDEGLSKSLSIWYDKLDEMYNNELFHAEEDLTRCRYKSECSLNNLVADSFRAITGADFGLYTPGCLRTDWHAGMISEAEVFMMFPFDNQIVTFEMTGKEIKRMIEDVQFTEIYPTSGLEQVFIRDYNSYNILVDLKLYDDVDDKRLDESKTYTVATNSFLAEGGDNMYKVRKWYDLRGYKEYGAERDTLVNYLSFLGNIKKGTLVDPEHPRARHIDFEKVALKSRLGDYYLEYQGY